MLILFASAVRLSTPSNKSSSRPAKIVYIDQRCLSTPSNKSSSRPKARLCAEVERSLHFALGVARFFPANVLSPRETQTEPDRPAVLRSTTQIWPLELDKPPARDGSSHRCTIPARTSNPGQVQTSPKLKSLNRRICARLTGGRWVPGLRHWGAPATTQLEG